MADYGQVGPAALTYDLRYSMFPIDPMSFATAIPLPTGAPQPPGSVESAVITGLMPGTTLP